MCLHKGRDFPARHRGPAGVQKPEEYIATAGTNVSREIMKIPSYRKAFHTIFKQSTHYLLQIKETLPGGTMSLPAPLAVVSPFLGSTSRACCALEGSACVSKPQHSQAGVV